MTLPTSGSMLTGALYARTRSALPTNANGSSSSPQLPTPTARDWKGAGYDGQLPNAAALLPTPRTSDTNGTGTHGDGGMDLRTTVSLLPTPRATDTGTPGRRASEGFRPPLSQVVLPLLPTPTAAGGDRQSATYGRGNPTLRGALLPTPRATDGTNGGPNQRGSKGDLALPAVAHRIGAPTPPPSTAGNTSSTAPRPARSTRKAG
ncbi:hypothetical protein ACFU99_17615 [Streptomyces sp. NPDC057654]|uniref:hypothetical protein n=1 Tax=Streptomyces sp. NPDC057654 TaxID=3346196 RepID=UPI0036C8409F